MKKKILVMGLLAVLIVTSGCIQSPTCGNGICEAGETPQSCPQDCGSMPSTCTEQGGAICENHQVCDGQVLNSSDTTRCCSGECKLPTSFDWRNRHGENWLSPVKDQGGVGTCWGFGFTGSFESQINLYYNQHINPNLSEQQHFDCGRLSCNELNCISELWDIDKCKGDIGTLDVGSCVVLETGHLEEGCNPYRAEFRGVCTSGNICQNWRDRLWKPSNYKEYLYHSKEFGIIQPEINEYTILNEEDLKKAIIESGPLFTALASWYHGMVLVGYDGKGDWKTIEKCWGGDICDAINGCISSNCQESQLGDQMQICEGEAKLSTYECQENYDEEDGFIDYRWLEQSEQTCLDEQICYDADCVDKDSVPLQEGHKKCAFTFRQEYRPDNGDINWVFKNSWGETWKEQGYGKIAKPLVDMTGWWVVEGPFETPLDKHYEIQCVDEDNDSFCNWGITENKPLTCPPQCKPEKDWDDSNPSIGALGVY